MEMLKASLCNICCDNYVMMFHAKNLVAISTSTKDSVNWLNNVGLTAISRQFVQISHHKILVILDQVQLKQQTPVYQIGAFYCL